MKNSTVMRKERGIRTVLVIDDDTSILEVLRIGLGLEGFEVATAGNGREALEMLERRAVDFVIADLMMPVMDGAAFLRRLRGELGSSLPVVVLTGVDRDEVADELEGEGGCLVLRKPVPIDAIVAALEALGRRKGEPER